MIPYELSLDLDKELGVEQTVVARQGERGSTVLRVEVVDGQQPFDLAGYDVLFECVTADGKTHHDDEALSVSGNVVTYTLHENVCAAVGIIKDAYFSLNVCEADAGPVTLKATTQGFTIVVLPDSDGHGVSQAYSSEIEDLMAKLRKDYEDAMAEWVSRYDSSMEVWGASVDSAVKRANDAASAVEQAIQGELGPLFDIYLDSKAITRDELDGIWEDPVGGVVIG